jgi:M6 family metalloprotease-like protein
MLLRLARTLAAALAALVLPSAAQAAFQEQIGLDQRVLVICVKTTDMTTIRRTAADWVSVLDSQVNPFMRMATYNQTSYKFERPMGLDLPMDGWFQLPYASTEWPGTTQAVRDAVKLADPYVNMNRYNRVTIIVNNPGFGGQCTDYQWVPVDEGVESTEVIDDVPTRVRLISVSAQNEWLQDSYWPASAGNTRDESASVIAHELGHQLRMPTHYGDVVWEPNIFRDSITPWDIMGLSPSWNDYVIWSKIERGWLNRDITTVGPPVDADITRSYNLWPTNSASNRRAIKIPFSGGDPFRGYVLEYRYNNASYTNRDANGSALQPGVLVTLVSEDPMVVFGHKALVMPNPAFPNDNAKATLRAGDVFEDTVRGIKITNNGMLGNIANVTVEYRRPPTNFNANIRPWGAPPFETPDIWVDSEKNGWGTYRYTDGAGAPVGNGDDAWVRQAPDGSWKVNRVYVRVRNTGPDPMSNVRAQVWVNDPPGLGDTGPRWAFLGTIIFPSVPGRSTRQQYVNWAPTVPAHTCIRVDIENYSGETDTGDNHAQENVSAYDTTASSPYKPVSVEMVVGNPLYQDMNVIYQVTNIPKRWKWKIEPRQDMIPARGEKTVKLTVYPPNPAVDTEYKQGQIFQPRVTSLFQFGDAWLPLNGVDVWTHLVYKDAIEVQGFRQAGGILAKGRLTALQPAVGGLAGRKVAVQLIYNDPNQSYTLTRLTTTDADGYFKASFGYKVLAKGKWILQASYAGDMLYQAVDSADVDMFW